MRDFSDELTQQFHVETVIRARCLINEYIPIERKRKDINREIKIVWWVILLILSTLPHKYYTRIELHHLVSAIIFPKFSVNLMNTYERLLLFKKIQKLKIFLLLFMNMSCKKNPCICLHKFHFLLFLCVQTPDQNFKTT